MAVRIQKVRPQAIQSGVLEVVSDAVIGGWFARKGEPIFFADA